MSIFGFGHNNVFSLWLHAARPRTLPAALAPVMVGASLAVADGCFTFLPALAALIGALLLQIAVNFANDYFDFKNGIDTEERLGPVRVTQRGLIEPEYVKKAMIAVLSAATCIGLYLTYIAGWPILMVGIAAIVASLSYSGGPFPLASNGLGDLFVFIFFGLVAVGGTYYVQALTLNCRVMAVSVPIGLQITAIIVVNNLRDIPTDGKHGKHTLAVLLGQHKTRIEYLLLIVTAYVLLVAFWVFGWFSRWILLPMLALPFFVPVIRTVFKEAGPILNQALARTAALALIFSLLLSVGLILAR